MTTLTDVEPIGPKGLFDVLVVAPCTGTTLGRLANGLSDSPVSLAVKSHLRRSRPVAGGLHQRRAGRLHAEHRAVKEHEKHLFCSHEPGRRGEQAEFARGGFHPDSGHHRRCHERHAAAASLCMTRQPKYRLESTQISGASGPLSIIVGSIEDVPAGFPKEKAGLAPESSSIPAGSGAGHPPLWCPTMALKIQISGFGELPPTVLSAFCRPFASTKGMALRPDFLLRYVRATGRQPNPVELLCAATSFLRAEKGGKETPGASPPNPQVIGRFSFDENRQGHRLLNQRYTRRGPVAPRDLGGFNL